MSRSRRMCAYSLENEKRTEFMMYYIAMAYTAMN